MQPFVSFVLIGLDGLWCPRESRRAYDQRRMIFAIFAVLAFVVLRLTFRIRWRTLILAALIIGLAADYAVDVLVTLRR